MRRLNPTAAGALSNLFAQGVPFALLIAVTPILVGALGREAYGVLVLFGLVPQIAGQIDLGLTTAATRGFANCAARGDRRGAQRLHRETLVLLVAWGCLIGCAYYALHPAIARLLRIETVIDDDSWVHVATAVSFPLAMAGNASMIPLRALERYGRVARVQVIAGLVYWTTCAIWVTHGGHASDLIVLGVVSLAVTTTIFLIAGRGEYGRGDRPAPGVETGGFPIAHLRPYLPVAASACVAQLSGLAVYHFDKLLIAGTLSPAAAGAYAICTSLANKILFVVAAGATYTFPRATSLHASGDHAGLVRVYRQAARASAAIAMALVVPMLGWSTVFLTLWLGAGFADDYAAVLRLLATGYAWSAASVVAANMTIGIGKARVSAVFAMLGGTMTVVALLILTPRYGVIGAAVASLIGMSQTIVFNRIVARSLGPEASASALPLLLRVWLVGGPIAIGIAFVAPHFDSWPLFAPAFLLSTLAFPAAWLATFGREHEWKLIGAILHR